LNKVKTISIDKGDIALECFNQELRIEKNEPTKPKSELKVLKSKQFSLL